MNPMSSKTELYRGTITRGDWLIVGGIIGVLLVLAAGFFFVVYAGQTERLAELQAMTATKQQELTRAAWMQQNIAELREQSDLRQRLVDDFEDRLPSTSEIRSLVTEFERMAREVDLRVDVSPLDSVEDANKETIPYRIVAQGSFHQITSFINRLERYTRFLKISDLDIGQEDLGVSRAEFILSTYRFIQSPNGQVAATAANGSA
jgi:Tfp pilus assembly protein PilO